MQKLEYFNNSQKYNKNIDSKNKLIDNLRIEIDKLNSKNQTDLQEFIQTNYDI